MNDTHVTIVGNVVDDPKLRQTKSGVPVASFRIASSSRRYNREEERWVDDQRLYATVTCWRGTAQNVAASLRKGHPVVAVGRLYCREYTKDEATRMSYELEADAVGHDMSRGTSQFSRISRSWAPTSVPVGSDGIPTDDTADRLELDEPADDGADFERQLVAMP